MTGYRLITRSGCAVKAQVQEIFDKALATILAVCATILIFFSTALAQQNYPNKTITLLFGFSVGSSGDIAARLEGDAMAKALGVSVVVRNVPGAGGRNAVTLLNRAKPDGYTMAIVNVPGQLVNQIVRKLPPDLRTFKWIGRSIAQPYFLQVSTKSGLSTLNDLKKRKKPLQAGITGTGGNTFPISVIATNIVGYPVHFIPGFTSPEIIANIMRGELEATTLPVSESNFGAISSGKATGVAVYTAERHPMLPDVPTGAEQGFPELAKPTVMGTNLIALPPGTPDAIVNKLEAALAKGLRDKALVKKIESVGNFVKPLTDKESAQLVSDMIQLVEKNTSLLKQYVK
jgi:tripartite-type tricarboxylate transporter receptor subunit TctC